MHDCTPKPRWPLVVTSVLFIAGCLFLGGLMLSGFARWDPCVWIAAVIFGVPAFAFSYWQYTATFRASQSSANVLRILLPLISLGGILISGLTLIEALSAGAVSTGVLNFILPHGIASICFAWVGFQNYRWHRSLISYSAGPGRDAASEARAPRTLRFGLAELLAVFAALSIVLAGATYGSRDIEPQTGAHVTPQEAHLTLPTGASDVCFRRAPRGVINYNFAIDEAGFWEWTKMPSCGGSLESKASGVKIEPVSGSFEICDTFSPNYVHTITRGWKYDFQIEDRGHQFAYDADQGRAYYYFHAH